LVGKREYRQWYCIGQEGRQCLDCIPQQSITSKWHSSKSKEPTTLQALTIIDLNTHFMEIVALKNKESITVACSLDQVWLCCYPRPVDCLHDNGTEFVSTEFQELLQSYDIREGKSPDDKKTPHFLLNFLQISTIFASFSRAHAGTLQNHSISPCTTTVRNNTVQSSTIFHSNLMLCINWFYEI
jgi:hypothetical protein